MNDSEINNLIEEILFDIESLNSKDDIEPFDDEDDEFSRIFLFEKFNMELLQPEDTLIIHGVGVDYQPETLVFSVDIDDGAEYGVRLFGDYESVTNIKDLEFDAFVPVCVEIK